MIHLPSSYHSYTQSTMNNNIRKYIYSNIIARTFSSATSPTQIVPPLPQPKARLRPNFLNLTHSPSAPLKNYPTHARLIEVGPRDGLQNEAVMLPTGTKLRLIELLVGAGLKHVEAGAFVSPKWVPQMADSGVILRSLNKSSGVYYPVLTPNIQGFNSAAEAGANEVAVFAAASESFSMKNINCTIAESLKRFEPVMQAAKEKQIRVRGYVSCVLGCPYEGEINPNKVAEVALKLIEMGCYEVSLGDTIGVGTAGGTIKMLETVLTKLHVDQVAVHFHDTYGQALSNILIALQHGIKVIDCSVAGLGGCPYAQGATGNVATEDVLYMLNGLGIETGVDMHKLLHVSNWISSCLGVEASSRVERASHATEVQDYGVEDMDFDLDPPPMAFKPH